MTAAAASPPLAPGRGRTGWRHAAHGTFGRGRPPTRLPCHPRFPRRIPPPQFLWAPVMENSTEFKAAECSGAGFCFPQWVSPDFVWPKVGCEAGYQVRRQPGHCRERGQGWGPGWTGLGARAWSVPSAAVCEPSHTAHASGVAGLRAHAPMPTGTHRLCSLPQPGPLVPQMNKVGKCVLRAYRKIDACFFGPLCVAPFNGTGEQHCLDDKAMEVGRCEQGAWQGGVTWAHTLARGLQYAGTHTGGGSSCPVPHGTHRTRPLAAPIVTCPPKVVVGLLALKKHGGALPAGLSPALAEFGDAALSVPLALTRDSLAAHMVAAASAAKLAGGAAAALGEGQQAAELLELGTKLMSINWRALPDFPE